jgi:hypothetical protein
MIGSYIKNILNKVNLLLEYAAGDSIRKMKSDSWLSLGPTLRRFVWPCVADPMIMAPSYDLVRSILFSSVL